MVYTEVVGALVMKGPTDILVSLGIENVVGLPLAVAYMYYNYIAVCLLFLVAAFAGQRSESRFCILISILSGVFFWFGWIHTGTSAGQLQFLALTVLMGAFGVFSYMNDVNHEKYGIPGPGSKLMNIAVFIIVFQVIMGSIGGFDIFADIGATQPSPNGCTVGYTCDEYGNIDLTQSLESVNNAGGLNGGIASLAASLTTFVLTSLKLIVNIMISVGLFTYVLNASIAGVFPEVVSNVAYIGFMVFVQVAIWLLYSITLFNWYFKPAPSEGSL